METEMISVRNFPSLVRFVTPPTAEKETDEKVGEAEKKKVAVTRR